MPDRKATRRGRALSRESIEAYIAGDDWALRRLLGLKPWQWPTLPPLDQDSPWGRGTAGTEWWPQGQALRRALEAAAAGGER